MFSANDIKTLREQTGAGMLDCKKALEETSGDLDKAVDWLREKGISKAAKKESRIAAEGLSEILVDGNKAIILEINSETDFVAKNEAFKDFITLVANTIIKSDATTMEEALELQTDEGTISEVLVALIAKIGEKLSFRRFQVVTKGDDEIFGCYSHMGGKITVLTVIRGGKDEVAKDVSMQAAAMKPSFIAKEDVTEDVIEAEKAIIKAQAINEGKTPEIAEKMVSGRINKFFKEVCLIEQEFIKDPDMTIGEYVSKNNCEIMSMIRYEVGEGIEKRQDDFASEVMNQING